jgi:hypothetical protein
MFGVKYIFLYSIIPALNTTEAYALGVHELRKLWRGAPQS